MTTASGGKAWGANSEYGRLHDVLLCEPVNFKWLPTSSISKATLRSGSKFDRQLAMRQHREMVQAYEEGGTKVHFLEPDEALPYQVYARDSSFMTPYGAVVTQMHQW
jgi:N-dimethylarginine dimethylaminohydrolase